MDVMIKMMTDIAKLHNKIKCIKRNGHRRDKGIILVIVLMVVMVVSLLAYGFLSRGNLEMVSGSNLMIRTSVENTAESGLEYAKGLLINPQDATGDYWTGTAGAEKCFDDDYYEISVSKPAGTGNRLNYDVNVAAYRLVNGQRLSQCDLSAKLRLDPAVALKTINSWFSYAAIEIVGDVYCGGAFSGNGAIKGDLYAGGQIFNTANITGRAIERTNCPIKNYGHFPAHVWQNYYIKNDPESALVYSGADYDRQNINFNPNSANKAGVVSFTQNLHIKGGVHVTGFLMVERNLYVSGSGNTITAVKNFPALWVGGKIILQDGAKLTVKGLAMTSDVVTVMAGAKNVDLRIRGALLAKNGITGVAWLVAGNKCKIIADPEKASVETWANPSTAFRFNPAGSAFFKSIKRN